MGKPTGFKEYKRRTLERDPVESRIKNYKEFEKPFNEDEAKIQGARCMDCGVPFCHGDTGCPVDNFIPEWNDLVYHGHWKDAIENLHSTNNFPEFTGRLCPAPCEGACVLGINEPAVSIKGIERTIIDRAFAEGWVKPRPPKELRGRSVAVIGSGPAGLAVAQQLARDGHKVVVYEKSDRIGGLLRYGIPDFKMEKYHIDRRVEQMEAEGVIFKTSVNVGVDIALANLEKKYDAIALAGGSEKPRDLPIPGRESKGIHFAMEFLTQQNKLNAGDAIGGQIMATDKNVVVIGGGDTGSDCVGTSNRQGAKSITQIELFPKPPNERAENTPWPYWPMKLRTSSSHEEGVDRQWSINTREFTTDENGNVKALKCVKIEMKDGKITDVPGSEFEIKAELVLFAMGFVGPKKPGLIEQLIERGVEFDQRGNIKAEYGDGGHQTSVENIYACGDIRRGQSLIVWAISEGRKCAATITANLAKVKA